MDEACRLRRDEGLREAPRAQALRRAIGLAERMQSEASLGACEDEALLFAYFFWRNRKSRPSETQLRCYRINGSPVQIGKEGRCGHRPLQTFINKTRVGRGADPCREFAAEREKEADIVRFLCACALRLYDSAMVPPPRRISPSYSTAAWPGVTARCGSSKSSSAPSSVGRTVHAAVFGV